MYRIISFLYSSSCRIAIQSRYQHGYQAEKRSAFKERKACCITTRNCLHSLTSFTKKRSRANICVCRMKDVFLMRVALVCLKSPTVFTIKQSFLWMLVGASSMQLFPRFNVFFNWTPRGATQIEMRYTDRKTPHLVLTYVPRLLTQLFIIIHFLLWK